MSGLASHSPTGACRRRSFASGTRDRLAHGDVVFFVDDDAVYLDGYAAAILGVYEADSEGAVGGVGTIANSGNPRRRDRAWRTSSAHAPQRQREVQASGWPALYGAAGGAAPVEVFSGPATALRR